MDKNYIMRHSLKMLACASVLALGSCPPVMSSVIDMSAEENSDSGATVTPLAGSVVGVLYSSVFSAADVRMRKISFACGAGTVSLPNAPVALGDSDGPQIDLTPEEAPVISAIPEPKLVAVVALILAPMGIRMLRNLHQRQHG
jgi:hypothetical protein